MMGIYFFFYYLRYALQFLRPYEELLHFYLSTKVLSQIPQGLVQ